MLYSIRLLASGLLISFINDSFGLLFASREKAKFNHLNKWRESDPALYGSGNASAQVKEINASVCLHIETHGISAVQM